MAGKSDRRLEELDRRENIRESLQMVNVGSIPPVRRLQNGTTEKRPVAIAKWYAVYFDIQHCDGFIVGSWFKENHSAEGEVCEAYVREFMKERQRLLSEGQADVQSGSAVNWRTGL